MPRSLQARAAFPQRSRSCSGARRYRGEIATLAGERPQRPDQQGGSCMSEITRRTALTLLAGSALLPAAALAAFPDRSVPFVVPFPPGGAVDIVARTISEQAAPLLGQTVIVDNRP